MAEASKKPENNLEKGTLVYVKEAKEILYPGIIYEQTESDYKVYFPVIQKLYPRKADDVKEFFTYPYQKGIKMDKLSDEPKYIKSFKELVFWSKVDRADRFPCLEQDSKIRMVLRDSKVDAPELTEEQNEIYEAYKYFKVINTPLMKDNMIMLKEFFDNLKKLEKRVAEGWLLEENEDQQRELIEDLETESSELRESNGILSKQLEDKKLMIVKLTKEKSALADQVQKLQEELAKAKEMNIQLTKNLTQNEKKLQESDEKIKDITAKNLKLKDEVSKGKDESKVHKLALEASEKSNQKFTQQVDLLKKEQVKLIEKLSTSKKDFIEKDKELGKTKDELQIKSILLTKQKEMLENKDVENACLLQKNQNLMELNGDITAELNQLNIDHKELKSEHKKLKRDFKKTDQDYEVLKKKWEDGQKFFLPTEAPTPDLTQDVSHDMSHNDSTRDNTHDPSTSGINSEMEESTEIIS